MSCQACSESGAYREERFLEERIKILPLECSMSAHLRCRTSPMRRPEENIRQRRALNFRSLIILEPPDETAQFLPGNLFRGFVEEDFMYLGLAAWYNYRKEG